MSYFGFPTGGVTDGDKGDITVSSSGTVWTIDAGAGGDMVLASTQTVSGLKTFLAAMFGLRNVANTFTAFFTNTITANRTYTLKDADGTIAFTSDITGTNSGTNSGDNSVNTLYSGLEASKLNATAFSGVAKITVGTSTPVGPSVGDLWVDTN